MATVEANRREYLNREGMRFVSTEVGPEDGPAVLFLHGGGQTRASWKGSVDDLGKAGFRAITLDLRGHGESEWSPDGRYAVHAFADDLTDILAQLPPRPALVGASLGGLTSLLVLGNGAPDIARALVLVDVVPRMEREGAREIKDFMSANGDGFASIDEAADAVAAYLPHRPRPRDPSGLLRNLRLREDGRYYWHWDPRMIASMGHADPSVLSTELERAARNIKIPTMLVRGGSSRVVSAEGAEALLKLIPHAEVAQIDGAHHMVAGDANDAFHAPLMDFLARTR
jgi:pimeloyl-ACP methyl ester carboxylesterase